jgi:hypothetical protein
MRRALLIVGCVLVLLSAGDASVWQQSNPLSLARQPRLVNGVGCQSEPQAVLVVCRFPSRARIQSALATH